MSQSMFDLDSLLAASSKYHSASQSAAQAGTSLAGLSLGGDAVGATASSGALAAALQSFHANQSQVASGNAQALVAFAQRLSAASHIGADGVDQSSAAATG